MGGFERTRSLPQGMRPMGQMYMNEDGQMFTRTTPFDGMEPSAMNSPMAPIGMVARQAKFEPEFIPVGGPQTKGEEESGYGTAKRLDHAEQEAEMQAPVEQVPSYDPKNPKKNAVPNNKDLKDSAKKLNKVAPPGERLAYINPAEEALLKSIGGSGKPSAGGVPSYKKGDVEAPPPRNYGQETRDTLQAQVDLAPQLYENEAQFRPQYANLERGIMLENLGIDPSLGLLEAYEDYIAPSQVRQKRKSVEGDIAMLKDLGGDLIEAQRDADPEAEALRQSVLQGSQDMVQRSADEMDGDLLQSLKGAMGGEIESGLRDEYMAGGGLTENEARDLDQQMLSMASARGMVGQNATDFSRMKAKLDGDRAIRQQRLNNYMRVKQQNLGNYQSARQQAYSNYGQSLRNAGASYQLGAQDPLMALTGRASRVPGDVSAQFGTAGFALQSSPAIFNPESNYAGALNASNQQNIMDARTATASNRAGMFSGMLGMAGSLGGGYLAGR
jgi:hypothetical protein